MYSFAPSRNHTFLKFLQLFDEDNFITNTKYKIVYSDLKFYPEDQNEVLFSLIQAVKVESNDFVKDEITVENDIKIK